MIRRIALGVAASAALFLGSSARADMPGGSGGGGGGGCGGSHSHSQSCPPTNGDCKPCTVGDSTCIDPLDQQGYELACQRGSVEYLCKFTAASQAGFDLTLPVAGILLGVSAWSTVRIGRRRAKGA